VSWVLNYTFCIYPINTQHSSRSSEKLTVSWLVKKFAGFNGARRFITMITRARHWALNFSLVKQSFINTPDLFVPRVTSQSGAKSLPRFVVFPYMTRHKTSGVEFHLLQDRWGNRNPDPRRIFDPTDPTNMWGPRTATCST
jgi:hypothetical protein